MTYRDDAGALRAKLVALRAERDNIEASIVLTDRHLRELQSPGCDACARTRRIKFTLIGLIVASCFVAGLVRLVTPRLSCCGGSHTADSRGAALTIATAAWMYVDEHPGGRCPTVSDLLDANYLGRSSTATDYWGNPFRITCRSEEPIVTSAGLDNRLGTSDDISTDPNAPG